MRVGFTGTRGGMTGPQREAVRRLLFDLKATEVHHGDCVGADADFHKIARGLDLRVVLHPPDVDTMRAFCEADESEDPLPYLDRNRRIVYCTHVLIATPKTAREEYRSGTWATVRYARRKRRQIHIIAPEGWEAFVQRSGL